FISLLFAKPRPVGLDSMTSIDRVWAAFATVATDTAARRTNLDRFTTLLTRTHGFTFTPDEQAAFDHVQRSFVDFGPYITTSGRGMSDMPLAVPPGGSLPITTN